MKDWFYKNGWLYITLVLLVIGLNFNRMADDNQNSQIETLQSAVSQLQDIEVERLQNRKNAAITD